MVEPDAAFVSCPMSNLVVNGNRTLTDITRPYDTLGARCTACAWCAIGSPSIDPGPARRDPGQSGGTLPYDKLVLSPGVEMIWDDVAGLREASRDGLVLQAWKAGPETVALRRQLEAMPAGGVYAIAIPEAPYRCPPGPYERASLIANYFQAHKPRAKVLILDANEDVTSKGPLFKKVWAETYKGMIEYRPHYKAISRRRRDPHAEVRDPGRRARRRAQRPAADAGRRDRAADRPGQRQRALVPGELAQPRIDRRAPHPCRRRFGAECVGDAQERPHGQQPGQGPGGRAGGRTFGAGNSIPAPMLTNTCYSHVDDKRAIHVASVHAYDAAAKTFVTVPGSGGLSVAPNELEAALSESWARSIWADMLG